MSKERHLTSVLLTVFIIVLALILFVFLLKIFLSNRIKTTDKDLYQFITSQTHPIYSHYKFSKNEHIINFGTQPLYLPTGLITETMKRDRILKKELKKLGMKIAFYPFLKGHDVNQFMKRGDLSVGIGGDMPAIVAAADIGVVITKQVQQGFTSIVTNNIFLMKELRNKKIAYSQGSNAHYTLLKALKNLNLTEDHARLIPMNVHEMVAALKAGKIHAFAAWEPTPHIALKQIVSAVRLYRNSSTGYLYFKKAFADQHEQAMYAIVASSIRAIQWMQASPSNFEKAANWSKKASDKILRKKTPLLTHEIKALSYKDIIGVAGHLNIPDQDLKQGGSLYNEFQFLKKLGILQKNITWKTIQNSFKLSIVETIFKQPIKYQINVFNYQQNRN